MRLSRALREKPLEITGRQDKMILQVSASRGCNSHKESDNAEMGGINPPIELSRPLSFRL